MTTGFLSRVQVLCLTCFVCLSAWSILLSAEASPTGYTALIDTTNRAADPVDAALEGTPFAPGQPHRIDFGGGYEPGPGGQLSVRYRYLGLPDSELALEVGWAGQLLGTASFTRVVQRDRTGRIRTTLTPRLFSTFTSLRTFEGIDTSERRTGAGLAAAARQEGAFRWSYQQQADATFARLHLDPFEGPGQFQDLTAVALGVGADRVAFRGLRTRDLALSARLRGGWLHGPDATPFATVRVNARWHRPLSPMTAYSIEALGAWATARTPTFERPSFGGNETVRGFRADAFIGRSVAGVQQEIWVPVPGASLWGRRVRNVLRQHIRMAAFADAGVVGGTLADDTTILRAGTGLGVRLRMGGFTLRADWAHRVSDLRDGQWGGGFFLTFRPDRALAP
jgi:hypothetical protein